MKDSTKDSIRKSSPPELRWGIARGQARYGQEAGTATPRKGFRGATGTGYETCRYRAENPVSVLVLPLPSFNREKKALHRSAIPLSWVIPATRWLAFAARWP